MSQTNLYRCTPRQVRGYILDCLYAGLVPFVRSSPGMGKSAINRSISNELQLKMIDHRCSTSAPEDFSGLPRFDADGHARFSPFADLFPLEDTPLPDGKDGWMLFLDEFNSAPKSVQAAAYKLVLDRMVGQYNLHKRVAVVMAGNLDTDRAITVELSTAMQSRVVHIEMTLSHEEWLEDVALKESYDHRIIAYLNYKSGNLMDFRPDHHEKTFCCPRTWEFMNRLVDGKDITDEKIALYAGTITSGVAVDFVQFTKVYQNMVTLADVRRNPTGCPIPTDTATKWAVISHLISQIDDQNYGDIATYANRFDLSFKILFHRSVMVRNPELRSHPAFAQSAMEVSRYLHGPASSLPRAA